MTSPCLVLAISLVHTRVFNPVVAGWVTVNTLQTTENWLSDWEKFKGMAGIYLDSDYQFAHLPAEAFSWAPFIKVRK